MRHLYYDRHFDKLKKVFHQESQTQFIFVLSRKHITANWYTQGKWKMVCLFCNDNSLVNVSFKNHCHAKFSNNKWFPGMHSFASEWKIGLFALKFSFVCIINQNVKHLKWAQPLRDVRYFICLSIEPEVQGTLDIMGEVFNHLPKHRTLAKAHKIWHPLIGKSSY